MNARPNSNDATVLRDTILFMWKVAGGATIALVVAYTVWFGFALSRPISSDPDAWGQFGDFLGGVLNPLIAFFALLLLSRGVQLQDRTLQVTKNELEESRELMRRQQFDSRYYAVVGLLAAHQRDSATATAFADAKRHVSDTLMTQGLTSTEHICSLLEQALHHYQRHVSPCIFLLQNLVGMLESGDVTPAERQTYLWPIRAFITPNEAFVLSALALVDQLGNGMPQLCEKYGLLRGVARDDRMVLQRFVVAHREKLPILIVVDEGDAS